jgi:glycosyltransferase involved in cell wall biosynthesis
MERDELKVLIVSDNISSRFGGEALLPLRYIQILRRKGVHVRAITHERNKDDLAQVLSGNLDGLTFIPDSRFHRLCSRWSGWLPPRISNFTLGLVSRIVTQRHARRIARELVAAGEATVVFQPTPVSPREFSFLYRLGAPVVMGPMNGNMGFPPGFPGRDRKLAKFFTTAARRTSNLLNRLIPGKIHAQVLLVANERTRWGLPRGCRGRVIQMVENAVELNAWPPKQWEDRPGRPVRFVFLGRLVGWKAVDLLIRAFSIASSQIDAELEIIGDGELRAGLEQLAGTLNVASRTHFLGWKSQSEAAERLRESDVFVLPSLSECGGAAVLEGMAVGLPIIATRWGGPVDYVDADCGILVEPLSDEQFAAGLAEAMVKLARSPEQRRAMGAAARRRAGEHFDWDAKVDALLEILRSLPNADGPAICRAVEAH